MRIGWHCAAGDRSSRWPGAMSRSTPASRTRAGGKRTRSSPDICCRAGPSWTSAASGGRTSRPPSRPSQRPSWQTRCWPQPVRSSAGRVRQDIIAANPCSGVERNNTTSRERVLSDAEIAAFWPHLSAPLKMILLTGQRPGEVAHLHRAHVVDDRWWVMPGAPDPKTSWPGTKNAQSHRVWLSEPVHELLPDVLAAPRAARPAAAGHARASAPGSGSVRR